MATRLTVLVVGATGRQGGAVARALLRAGHDVHAMTRNLAHPEAMRLMRRGARLAWAAPRDEEKLVDVASRCDAIFLMTPDADGPESELRDGHAMVKLARRVRSPHVVFSSAIGATGRTGVPHYDSKFAIEQLLRESQVPHTVVAPAFFMENFLTTPFLSDFRGGRLALPWPAQRKLQQVALEDVGRFVVHVLERRADFLGLRIPIASDELTGIEMAATLARVMHRSIVYEEQTPGEHAPSEERNQAAAFNWLQKARTGADVQALRATYDIGWHTLDGWARRQDWASELEVTS